MIADLALDAVKNACLKVSDTNGIMYSKPKVIETFSTVHTSFVIDNADIHGVEVPAYFQIGFWPSVEMAIDYLAWGFFMGFAFLCIGIAIKNRDKTERIIKTTLLICGILCLIGFFGTVFVNENIWYIAPMGYGLGTMIICIQMMKFKAAKCLDKLNE